MSTKGDVQQGDSDEQGEGEADVPGRQSGGKMKQTSMTLYREDLNEDIHVDDASPQ